MSRRSLCDVRQKAKARQEQQQQKAFGILFSHSPPPSIRAAQFASTSHVPRLRATSCCLLQLFGFSLFWHDSLDSFTELQDSGTVKIVSACSVFSLLLQPTTEWETNERQISPHPKERQWDFPARNCTLRRRSGSTTSKPSCPPSKGRRSR